MGAGFNRDAPPLIQFAPLVCRASYYPIKSHSPISSANLLISVMLFGLVGGIVS
jgi:hypothetical protein